MRDTDNGRAYYNYRLVEFDCQAVLMKKCKSLKELSLAKRKATQDQNRCSDVLAKPQLRSVKYEYSLAVHKIYKMGLQKLQIWILGVASVVVKKLQPEMRVGCFCGS
jgi:hypothetical protein